MASISWDFGTATLSLIAIQIIGFIVFVVRVNSKADAALGEAKEAQEEANRAQMSAAAQSANLALFREQVAANYVDRESIREIKRELIDAINTLGDRLDLAMRSNGHK